MVYGRVGVRSMGVPSFCGQFVGGGLG